ncbi:MULTISPECIES: hypothetical protein [unclassified Ensifer]|uniref:hypothetical protein n=1 Tax=unclassified Ensifer TaxID=2633371 RepID=UPI00081376D9|nr:MULTISPECIES: hypothetical protein [unclassified Ensifer]OCP21977.1 hypothetical protein BC361_25760 [Ensifer sp. LC54]OCP23243.1 hypothetical protein BC363_25005 [Ensifer sp. LC384]
MDTRLKPKSGQYLLLHMNVLAQAGTVDESGFKFSVINGGWSGRYTFATNSIFVDGIKETRDCEILCVDQPPPDVVRDGYHAMIPWMRIRAGIADERDLRMFGGKVPEPEFTFTMTCTELHTATYTVKAASREEAMKKWEQLDWSAATDRTLQDSSDMALEEAA